MQVLCFGTYERRFPRNTTLIAGLRQAGAVVNECHEPLWELTRDKTGSSFTNPLALLRTALRVALVYGRLILRHRRMRYDVMVVGYMGYLDMLVAAPLARLRGRPLAYSPVVSLYETVVTDRRMARAGSIIARLTWRLDAWALKLADLVILETNTYIDFFSREFAVPREKFVRVLLGADERTFSPAAGGKPRSAGTPLRVFFYGKFTPLQGVPVIVRAASIIQVRVPGIRFEIVGSGQLSGEVRRLAAQLELSNTKFVDWVEYERLPEHIGRADVSLGIFGETEKTQRGIPVKVYDALAMGKPIITGDTPAAREILTDGENALLCPIGDPQALADRIERLDADRELLKALAAASYRTFQALSTQEIIGQRLHAHLGRLVAGGRGRRGSRGAGA